MVEDLQTRMCLHQFTLFDDLKNLIRVLVGFEITVDIKIVCKVKQWCFHWIAFIYLFLILTLDSTS